MKVTVVSRDARALKRIEKKLLSSGFALDKKKPEIVFVYGGDGSVVYSERLYPSVPKVAIKGSITSKTRFYDESLLGEITSKIKLREYEIREYAKLEARFGKKTLEALNEIQVHNKNPFVAVRFNVSVGGVQKYTNIVGDGALVSTPFGSGAYYYSLGGRPFERGLGLGFNNPHTRTESEVLPEDSVITIHIVRGDAYLIRDNDEKMHPMKPRDRVKIRKSSGVARFLIFNL